MKLKTNLDEILYDRIIECLVSGEYVMGQNLTLNELAEKFEVSRTPVVQAIKQLSNDGVLQIMSNGRIYVPEYAPETVRQICEVRQLIEGHALTVFMSGGGTPLSSVLPQLERYAKQCSQFSGEEKPLEFATADRKFHRTLVESAGNGVLTETYTRVQGRFTVVNYLIRPLSVRDFKGTVDGHYEFLEAVKAGDGPRAQHLLKDHIERVARSIERP